MRPIQLSPISKIDPFILDYLEGRIRDIFKTVIIVGSPLPLPHYAYNDSRGQYHSTKILDEMRKGKASENRLLGIIDADLFVLGLNFVFGEAEMVSGVAIIGLTRLRPEFYGGEEDDGIFLQRVLKEAVHELGHTYGLGHCKDARCVMRFSNSISDTDRKDWQFCKKCSVVLKAKMLHAGP